MSQKTEDDSDRANREMALFIKDMNSFASKIKELDEEAIRVTRKNPSPIRDDLQSFLIIKKPETTAFIQAYIESQTKRINKIKTLLATDKLTRTFDLPKLVENSEGENVYLRHAKTVKSSGVPDNIEEINEWLSASEAASLSICSKNKVEAIRAKYRRVRNYFNEKIAENKAFLSVYKHSLHAPRKTYEVLYRTSEGSAKCSISNGVILLNPAPIVSSRARNKQKKPTYEQVIYKGHKLVIGSYSLVSKKRT